MEITDIKDRLSIIKVLQHYNLTPNQNHMLPCPFHDDKKPSMKIYPETNSFHCFGCGAAGDQVKFIELKEGKGKHEALLKAKSLTGENTIPIKSKPMQVELSVEAKQAVFTKYFGYCYRSLNMYKPAQEYLQQRAIDHKKITAGYDSGLFYSKAGKNLIESYLSAGLLKPAGRENNYRSFFKNCIVFPTCDKNGKIAGFYGKNIQNNGHYNLEGKHSGLYPGYPDPATRTIIFTEGILDCATLQQYDFITVKYSLVSFYGSKVRTGEHEQIIKDLPELQEAIFFFDGDKAGKEGVTLHAEKFKQINPGLKISYVNTPEGEDINSLAQSHEDPRVFTELIETRTILVNGKTNNIFHLKEDGPVCRDGKPNQPINQSVNHRTLITSNPEYILFETDTLSIRLWGGVEMHNLKKLRVTMHIQDKTNQYNSIRDTIDLYSHSQAERFTRQASERLEISTQTVSNTLTLLTTEIENYRIAEREKQRQKEEARRQQEKDIFTTDALRDAEQYLSTHELHLRTYKLFNHLGLIGQEKNGCLLFFIYLTRMLENPLHAIVMGKSATGKTYLLKTVARLVPKQHIHYTTSLSENTLYYTPEDFLRHKILLQEDLDGAYNALLPLRELMSNQCISRFSTKTNNRTGNIQQVYLEVHGPVCIAGATTKDRIYEDNANRSFLLQLDETPEYEDQVLAYQGKIESGQADTRKQMEIINLIKACQLLLQPVKVINPYAPELKLPSYVFKKMRTNKHYLTLIKSIAFWNQKQRTTKTDKEGMLTGTRGAKYIEVSLEDIELANYLCKDLLLRKADELSGELRRFHEHLKQTVKQSGKKTFYAKQVRNRMHPQKLKRWLDELQSRGYILKIGNNRKTSFEYEILNWTDYEELKQDVDILDKITEKLRKKQLKKSEKKSNHI